MEAIPILLALSKELGTPVLWAALFVAALYAAQRFFGGWFEMARASTANHADAQAKTNSTMLQFIERLNGEIARLSEAESTIMERLAECERRHRVRDEEVTKLQGEVAALQIKLFSVGLGKTP